MRGDLGTDTEAATPRHAMPYMLYHAVLHSILPSQPSHHLLLSLFETDIPIEDQVGKEVEMVGGDVRDERHNIRFSRY